MIVFWISEVPSPDEQETARSRMSRSISYSLENRTRRGLRKRFPARLGAVLGGEQLGHAGLDVVALTGVLEPGRRSP